MYFLASAVDFRLLCVCVCVCVWSTGEVNSRKILLLYSPVSGGREAGKKMSNWIEIPPLHIIISSGGGMTEQG